MVGLALVPGVSPAAPRAGGDTRDIKFRILYQHSDGAWLAPTLEAVRSARQWESAMDNWLAKQEVVGREPAPAIDWSHDAVIVLSLGTQVRQTGVEVRGCRRAADLTMVDLHFDTGGDAWDPLGTVEHPCVVLSVAQEDLKELRLLCDATIDGLPMGIARRGHFGNGAIRSNAAPAAVTTTAASAAAADAVVAGPVGGAPWVTWGLLKARYRGPPVP
jgi:hypothetical protein